LGDWFGVERRVIGESELASPDYGRAVWKTRGSEGGGEWIEFALGIPITRFQYPSPHVSLFSTNHGFSGQVSKRRIPEGLKITRIEADSGLTTSEKLARIAIPNFPEFQGSGEAAVSFPRLVLQAARKFLGLPMAGAQLQGDLRY
jgi:hypothetical protein